MSVFDYNELVKTGGALMPNSGSVKIRVPLSQYYKRKMFYDKVIVNGSQYWQLNELGLDYNAKRKPYLTKDLISRYEALLSHAHIKYDASELADYVLNHRGFIKSLSLESSFSVQQRVDDCDLVNYSTCSDKLQFGCRGLTFYWLGDSQQGYLVSRIPHRVTLKDFISHNVYLDEEKEAILKKFDKSMLSFNQGKQELFKSRQRAKNLAKMLVV